jgi:hypothetical protein
MSFRGLPISLRALHHPEGAKRDCFTIPLTDFAHRRQGFRQQPARCRVVAAYAQENSQVFKGVCETKTVVTRSLDHRDLP